MDRPTPTLTPEQRRTKLLEVADAAARANRATRRRHLIESRRRLAAERRAARTP